MASLPPLPTESGELLRTLDAGLRAARGPREGDAVLARLGFDAAALRRPGLRTPLAARELYFEAVSAVTGLADPVPLLAAHIPVPGRFVLSYLLLSSPSLREGWARIARYLRLVSDGLHGGLVETGEEAVLVIAAGSTPAAGDLAAERLLLRGVQLVLQRMMRGFEAAQITLRGAAPADPSAYEAAFGGRVRFEADETALRFPQAWLDLPSPFEDATLLHAHLAHAEAAMTTLAERECLLHLRQYLATRLECGTPRLEDCAAALALKPRQLRHALAQSGTSFARVLDGLRRELSQRLLAHSAAELAEISTLAGFSGQSAFQRAFRRWNATTPQSWRAAHAPP